MGNSTVYISSQFIHFITFYTFRHILVPLQGINNNVKCLTLYAFNTMQIVDTLRCIMAYTLMVVVFTYNSQ